MSDTVLIPLSLFLPLTIILASVVSWAVQEWQLYKQRQAAPHIRSRGKEVRR